MNGSFVNYILHQILNMACNGILPPPPPPLSKNTPQISNSLCFMACGNILASGNVCFRVFKLQLKLIKMFVICTVHA